jgi:hypothetical protein
LCVCVCGCVWGGGVSGLPCRGGRTREGYTSFQVSFQHWVSCRSAFSRPLSRSSSEEGAASLNLTSSVRCLGAGGGGKGVHAALDIHAVCIGIVCCVAKAETCPFEGAKQSLGSLAFTRQAHVCACRHSSCCQALLWGYCCCGSPGYPEPWLLPCARHVLLGCQCIKLSLYS